jgi:hypothetical protein
VKLPAPGRKIVTRTPLASLWRDDIPIDAQRGPSIGDSRVRELLRSGDASLVIADVGHALAWYDGNARFHVWKTELRPRLVPPERRAFRLEDYPGGYCYCASEWQNGQGRSVVLFERHH